jgi:superfamily II DNA or RNA helicase
VLLFTCTQQQAEQQNPYTYHSANSQSEVNLARFSAGTTLRLAYVAQLAESINIPDLRIGIIWHSYGNERRAAQRIGWLLRLSPNEVGHGAPACLPGCG